MYLLEVAVELVTAREGQLSGTGMSAKEYRALQAGLVEQHGAEELMTAVATLSAATVRLAAVKLDATPAELLKLISDNVDGGDGGAGGAPPAQTG